MWASPRQSTPHVHLSHNRSPALIHVPKRDPSGPSGSVRRCAPPKARTCAGQNPAIAVQGQWEEACHFRCACDVHPPEVAKRQDRFASSSNKRIKTEAQDTLLSALWQALVVMLLHTVQIRIHGEPHALFRKRSLAFWYRSRRGPGPMKRKNGRG